jgi:hypothetical protein
MRGIFAALSAFGCSGVEVEQHAYPICAEVDTPQGALREKAAHFDDLAQRIHTLPGQDLLHPVTLDDDLETVKVASVRDNTGMWTSLYASSQAFRYAATKDPEALENLRRAFRGEMGLLRITGVRGLFARSMVDRSVPGFPTEAELNAPYPGCDLSVAHCKRWVAVDDGEFAGFLFKNDVSKDEYAGHMFAVGVIAELVDDPELRAMATEMAAAVADHMIDHDLLITDFDGATTTFGVMSPLSVADFPGFNAVLLLSWLRLAAELTGDPKYEDYYQGCFLHRDPSRCTHPSVLTSDDYLVHLEAMGLDLGCQTNPNNHNMSQLAMFNLIRHEPNATLVERYRNVLEHRMWNPQDRFPMRVQENSLFTFFWEANRGSSRPYADTEIDQAVCTMKRFPAEKFVRHVDTLSKYTEVCRDRKDEPMTDVVIPMDERQVDHFIWTRNPYRMEQDAGNRTFLESPEDYLLAYWVGRYFGFLSEDL